MKKVMFCFYIKDKEMIRVREKKLQSLLPECQVVLATTTMEIEQHLPDVEVMISTAFFPIGRVHLEKAKGLRLIQISGAGTDHVDLAAAASLGIRVQNVEGANAVSVAEHVVMSAMILLRDVVTSHQAMQKGEWPFEHWSRNARELAGKTLGIVGMGCIGQEVARRFAPFGVSLIFYARRELDFTNGSFVAKQVDMETLLSESDILTLHVPLTNETHHLLDKENLCKMKKGAFLINTSRADIVDEEALLSALNGHLAGAAIDVFHDEPLPREHPFRQLPNMILSPHGSGVTVESQRRIFRTVMANVLRFLNSKS